MEEEEAEEEERVTAAYWWRKFYENRVWVFSIFHVFLFKRFSFQYCGSTFLKNVSYILYFLIVSIDIPNSLNLYILGLQTTNIFIRSMLCFALFKFLYNYFILVSEPKISLNLYKHNAITRIDGSCNSVKFHAYYFVNYDTVRKDFDQKNYFALHNKVDLNLHLVERTVNNIASID